MIFSIMFCNNPGGVTGEGDAEGEYKNKPGFIELTQNKNILRCFVSETEKC